MNKGFTLIETVIVMVIVIIISAVVITRWNFDPIKLNSTVRKVAEDIRYAQKLAITTQTRAGIVFTANGYSVYRNVTPPQIPANLATSPGDPCSTDPANAFVVDFTNPRCSNYSGVTVSAITIAFNSLGTPVNPGTGAVLNVDQTVTVTYKGSKPIIITQGTGRVSY